MIFDFTNYTFSGLLSILASLYGVGYPLIMQSIGRIYTQYDSTLLANRFTKETIYRVFQVLLILNLLFAVSTPFLLHAEWWNIGFVTIQAILLVLLMGFTFLLFQLMIKYENAGELLRHIEGGQIDKSNIMDIFDLAIYADSKNNHQLYIDAMSSVFSYITVQQGDDFKKQNDNEILPPVVYDENVVAILRKIKGFIREDDGHHLLHRNNDIVSVLYNQLSKSRISLQAHQMMWFLLNEAITYNNHSWFKQYWQFADSYSSLRYRFVANQILSQDKKEFMLRHVMIGTLLLHNERYKWLNDIFLYTHSEPEYYGLIPSTFIEIVEMLENIDSICTVPAFQQQNFYFADEMGGVNDEKFVFRKAVKYLSLLVIRLWTLQYRNLYNINSLFHIPSSPILIEDAERVYFFVTGSSGLVAREMKLRFMRLGVVCEAITDQDGFAWTTSIMDDNCLVLGFSLSGSTQSILDSLLDAKEMGAKTVLFTSVPNKENQLYTETVLVASHNQSSYIQRISSQLPMLFWVDLIYAYFLEINRENKEKIFNSYWENKKLNGYRRQRRARKS